MFDKSRNHKENLMKRLQDLEKIRALNEKAIIVYGDSMTDEAIGVIRAQNALVALEIEEIKKEIGA